MKFPPMIKRNWVITASIIAQFILGFVLGVTLIAGVGAGIAYYYFVKMSSHVPTKPVFQEEKQSLPSTKKDAILKRSATRGAKEDSSITLESTTQPEAIAEPTPEPESTPKPEPISEPESELPPNAYFARVTWPQGLSLRAEPALDAERIGGIGFNAKIIILEYSSDKKWQRVRIPKSQREGWIKAGNTQPATIGEQTPEPQPNPEPEPISEPESELPSNAYFARVTWPQGLSLRAEPSLDAKRIGGIGFNTKIIILEYSSDKKWQRVRIPGSQREGWVKAGNVKKD